jgi:uncharacterized membrane protein
LTRQRFNIYAGLFVYVLLAVGIYFLVLGNMFSNGYFSTFLVGAFFGLIVYGIYDFTNYSTLKNWSLKLSFVDWGWGGFVCAISSLLGRYLYMVFS